MVPEQQELDGFSFVVSEVEGSDAGVFMLHGTGGDEYDMVDLGRYAAPQATLISARGRAPENGMNRWFRRHAPGVLDVEDIRRRADELAEFIPNVRRRYGVADDRLWAVGFSNGANMAAAMLLLHPTIFTGAVLLRPMLPLTPEALPDLTGVPVYIAAGTQDTMIPGDSTRELIATLNRAGADVTDAWAHAGHRFGREEVETVRVWLDERIT